MQKLTRSLVLACCALSAPSLWADDEPVPMSREELLAFLPGTMVTHVNRSGSLRRWTNEADGKFIASTDGKKHGNVLGSGASSAPGTWRVSDEGRYCIQIDWKRDDEKWCSSIVKGPDGSFYLGKVEDAKRIEFKRP